MPIPHSHSSRHARSTRRLRPAAPERARRALALALLGALSCAPAQPAADGRDDPERGSPSLPDRATSRASPRAGLIVESLPGPAAVNARWPAWGRAEEPLLLWSEVGQEGDKRLVGARLRADGWSLPATIADGGDCFVNWADVPQAGVASERALLVSWLRQSQPDGHAYSIELARSQDGGTSWSACGPLLADVPPAEYGFVTLTPLAAERFSAIWLDGRDTLPAQAADGAAEPGASGAMALRAAVIDSFGRAHAQHTLDERVCDCCCTDATLLASGELLVVYRDRDAEEVRDISIVRGTPGRPASWSAPLCVHQDGWQIAGCPVNGPRIASRGQDVRVAWFTLEDNQHPRVRVARSLDGGRSFGPALRIDDGEALGRVELAFLGDGRLVVAWLASADAGAGWFARIVDERDGLLDSIEIARASGGRGDGFLRFSPRDGELLAAFQGEGESGIEVVRLRSL